MSPLTHLHDPSIGRGQMPVPTLVALSIYKKMDTTTNVYLHIAMDSERTLYQFEQTTISKQLLLYGRMPGVTVDTFFTKWGARREYARACQVAISAGWQLQLDDHFE